MKLQQVETVTRYQVYFEPPEAAVLSRHPKWQHRIGRRKSGQPGGDATLTKTELSEVCDALGVNGREWLAQALAAREASEWDTAGAIVEAMLDIDSGPHATPEAEAIRRAAITAAG